MRLKRRAEQSTLWPAESPAHPPPGQGDGGGLLTGGGSCPKFSPLGREVGPRWVLAENPLGIASLEPHGLDWVCDELEAAGYEVWPVVVGARHVGAPPRRARVWIVAHRRSSGRVAWVARPHAGESDAARCGGDVAQRDSHGVREQSQWGGGKSGACASVPRGSGAALVHDDERRKPGGRG